MKQETIRAFHNHFIAPAFNLFSFTLRESPTDSTSQIQASSLQEDTFTCSFSFILNQEKHSSTSIYTHHTDDNSNNFRWENRHTCQSTRNTNPQPHRRKRPTNIGQKYHDSNTRLSSPPTLSFNKSYESIKVLGYHYR